MYKAQLETCPQPRSSDENLHKTWSYILDISSAPALVSPLLHLTAFTIASWCPSWPFCCPYFNCILGSFCSSLAVYFQYLVFLFLLCACSHQGLFLAPCCFCFPWIPMEGCLLFWLLGCLNT